MVTAVRDMRFKRITIPVLNHQIKIANPSATKVSDILGFQCLLASNLPSRHHAHIGWQSMVLDRQEVQAKESEAARNGPTCTL